MEESILVGHAGVASKAEKVRAVESGEIEEEAGGERNILPRCRVRLQLPPRSHRSLRRVLSRPWTLRQHGLPEYSLPSLEPRSRTSPRLQGPRTPGNTSRLGYRSLSGPPTINLPNERQTPEG